MILDIATDRFGECLGDNGIEARFRCPYHEDTVGKLYVNLETGLYLCFGGSCGAKGKIDHANVDDEIGALRARLKRFENNDAAEPVQTYDESWLRQFTNGHPYWTTVRRFTPKTVKRFNLGFDPQTNRLTIPIRDSRGLLLGAIYRSLGNEKPKYLHPRGFRTGRHLFGAHLVGGRTKVALVEGPLDAVACWDARVPALAIHGSRLTDHQAHLLRWLGVDTVVPFFDRDAAGRRAAERVAEVLDDMIVYHGTYRPTWSGKDPGELGPDQRRIFYNTAERGNKRVL